MGKRSTADCGITHVVLCAVCIAFRLLASIYRSIFTRRKNQFRLSSIAMDSSTMDSSSQAGTSLLSVSSPSSSKASLGRETNMLASSACVHHGGQLCVQIATDEPEASHIFAVDFGMFEQQVRYRPRELGEFQKVRLKMLSTWCGATPSMKSILCCENATSRREASQSPASNAILGD